MNTKHALALLLSVGLLGSLGCSVEKKDGPDLPQLTKDVWNRLREVEKNVRDAEHAAPLADQIKYAKLAKKLAALRTGSAGDLATYGSKVMTMTDIKKMGLVLDDVEKELKEAQGE